MATRSSRPSGIVVVHQALPAVAAIMTRSPSWSPFSRNATTAALARCVLSGDMLRLSKTTTNVRPGRRGAVFVAMRGGSAGAAWARRGASALVRRGDHVEVHQGLGSALVEDGEVLAGEPGDGVAGLVRDHHVHGHHLHLALEGGRRLLARRAERGGEGEEEGGEGDASGPAAEARPAVESVGWRHSATVKGAAREARRSVPASRVSRSS